MEYYFISIDKDEKQFQHFKENVIEILQGKGFREEKAKNLYECSHIDKMLRSNPDYVLHYNMEYWADWILQINNNSLKS